MNIENLSKKLNNRINVYSKETDYNSIGELDYKYTFLKRIWAEIKPIRGIERTGQADMVYSEVTHKITIRSNSLNELTNDMYFIFNSQRYDVMYFMPNYKYKNYIEIFCLLRIE